MHSHFRQVFPHIEMFATALGDLRSSLAAWRLWCLLGWLEIRQRYARSTLGPFWLTISMGVIVGSIGVVYGTLFNQDIAVYLPMMGIGLVFWGLLTSIINESCMAYINSAGYIRQTATPKQLFMLQAGWRNFLIFLHNFLIVILLLAVFGSKNWSALPLFSRTGALHSQCTLDRAGCGAHIGEVSRSSPNYFGHAADGVLCDAHSFSAQHAGCASLDN